MRVQTNLKEMHWAGANAHVKTRSGGILGVVHHVQDHLTAGHRLSRHSPHHLKGGSTKGGKVSPDENQLTTTINTNNKG